MVKTKQKSWIWLLTWPFAHENFTTIGETVYFPKSYSIVPGSVMTHELVHVRQQKEVGLFKYLMLYLFALPILWNPWRFKWELEAYMTLYTKEASIKKLRSVSYGWLING